MANEPIVTLRSLPAGYSFVPKGNVYITGNCRKQAQGAHKTVHIVVNAKQNQIGIAVPNEIHDDVRRMEVETRADRAKNVERKDASIENEFGKVIRQEFPSIPAASLPQVLKTALKKGKGKVGRTSTLDMRQKAHLAIRAHIRHSHTPYDQLMRAQGDPLPKHKARVAVQDQVDSIARSWGGRVSVKRSRRHAVAKSAAVNAATTASAAAPPKKRTPAPDEQQKQGLDQEPLPIHPSGAEKGAVRRSPVASDTVIDLTQDDLPQRALLSRRPFQRIPGQDEIRASQVAPNLAALPEAATKAARRAKKPKKTKKKRKERPAKGRLRQPARITRSMQHIEQTMEELVKRLPDSPEPELPPRPTARAQRR